MSYQPQVPPTFQQPPPPVVATPKGKRRKGLIVFGLVVLLAGLAGGGALVTKSMSNYEDAVKSMARAPVGCTTTLVFDKTGTFTIYVETKGKIEHLSGDCDATDGEYDHSSDKLPRASLTLLDSKGDEVDLPRGVSATYDAAGYQGTAVREAKIDEPGTYRLNVESDESDFAVSIGKTPKEDADLLKTIGGAVALGGLVLGLTFFLLGLRRRKLAAAPPTGYPTGPVATWTPTPYVPAPPGPPPPPRHPGYRAEPPEPPQPQPMPGQPPVHLPDPPGGGFAPPSVTPPPPPPPSAAPPSSGWAVPEQPDDH